MTTTVTITGTGCPIPVMDRAGPGVLVTSGDVHLQFDAGRSTVNRLLGAGTTPGKLTALFLTHHHSDHTVGLQDVVLTRWVMDHQDRVPPLPVIAPEGPAIRFAERVTDIWQDDIAVRQEHTGRTASPAAEVIGFPSPDGVVEVWRSDGSSNGGPVVVKAGEVRHEPVLPAVGYRVETSDGVVAITGDTLVCDEVAALAEGADILVYEALRFGLISADAPNGFVRDYHADTVAIGAQAKQLGVPTLVLTHLIPPPRHDRDEQGFVDDVRSGGYEGDLIVARDLSSITLG